MVKWRTKHVLFIYLFLQPCYCYGFPVALLVKNPSANTGDRRDSGSIPGLGRSPGVGNGNPTWYSCLENPMDRGAWRATVHGSAKTQTRTSNSAHTDRIKISSCSY